MNLTNHTICLFRSSGIRFLFAAVASCLLLQTASATQFFSDGFNYTAGTTLHGNGGWTLGGPSLSITNANLTYPNLADLGGNSLSITQGSASSTVASFNATSITTGTVYFSFVLTPTALPTANNELAALLASGSSGPGGSGDPLGLYVGQQSASQYKIGVRRGGSGATYATNAGLTLGSTNFFVVAYTFNTVSTTDDSVSLWINPTPGGSMPVADATMANSGSLDAANLQVIGFKAQGNATTGNWVFDTLRVGDTWADVTPTVVPEPSTVMLVGGGFSLVFGLIRRRRS